MFQLGILVAETVIVLAVVVVVHKFRRQIGLGAVYAVVMLLMLSTQWTSDLGSLIVFRDLRLYFASTALFSGILMGIFLVCVFDGIKPLRRLFFAMTLAQIYYVMVVGFLSLIGQLPPFIAANDTWIANHLFSFLAVSADVVLAGFLWGFFSKNKPEEWLAVKIFVVFLAIAFLDTVIFVGGTFWGNPTQAIVLQTGLLVRGVLALLITPMAVAYLQSEFKRYGISIEARSGWEFFGSLEDIESRIRADSKRIMSLEDLQQELEKRGNDLLKFQQAVNYASDHIVITDPDGNIVYANKSVERITGFKPEEIMGKKAGSMDLWGGQMPKEFYAEFWHVIKEEKKPFVGEITNKRKDGRQYTALASVSPVLDKNGKVIFFIGVERDISKEKEIDRMKTEFISMTSHQLKTPIASLSWLCELLLAGDAGSLNEEQAKLVSGISDSTKSMLNLVNSLLNISRIESGRLIIEPKPTKLKEIAEAVISEVQPKVIEKKIKVVLDVEADLPVISVDDKLIREVYKNLLTNALKYSPAGTEIRVTIYKKEDELVTQVTDRGYGIPKSQQNRTFEKFFRADNVYQKEEGTGLGLYLTKAIVEASGGRIWFESEENEGSSFWFSLPMSGSKKQEGEVSLG